MEEKKKKVLKKGIKYGERRIEITIYTNFLKYIGVLCILVSAFSFFYAGDKYFVTIITLIVIGLVLVAGGQAWEIYDRKTFSKIKEELGGKNGEDQDYL